MLVLKGESPQREPGSIPPSAADASSGVMPKRSGPTAAKGLRVHCSRSLSGRMSHKAIAATIRLRGQRRSLCSKQREDFAGDITLEAAHDLGLGLALGGTAGAMEPWVSWGGP